MSGPSGARCRSAALTVLLGCLGSCALTEAAPDPEVDRAYYRETAPEPHHLYPDDLDFTRVDYTRLRRGRWLSLSESEGPAVAAWWGARLQAHVDRDRRPLFAAAQRRLETDFTDLQAHLESARALHDRQPQAATFHETVARGLLDSIFASGDGSAARPLLVFTGLEQRAVLEYLGLRAVGQERSVATTPRRGWSAPRRVEVRDRSGRLIVLHFASPTLPPPSTPTSPAPAPGAASPGGRSSASPVAPRLSRTRAARPA